MIAQIAIQRTCTVAIKHRKFLHVVRDIINCRTAIRDFSDFMPHFQNTIRRCINSIAILILTNCLMPLLTVLVLKRLLGKIFHITIPMPPMRSRRRTEPKSDSESDPEPVAAGEKRL